MRFIPIAAILLLTACAGQQANTLPPKEKLQRVEAMPVVAEPFQPKRGPQNLQAATDQIATGWQGLTKGFLQSWDLLVAVGMPVTEAELAALCKNDPLFDPRGNLVLMCDARKFGPEPAPREHVILVPAHSVRAYLDPKPQGIAQAQINANLLMSLAYAPHVRSLFGVAGTPLSINMAGLETSCLAGIHMRALAPMVSEAQWRVALGLVRRFIFSGSIVVPNEVRRGYMSGRVQDCLRVVS